MANMKVDLEQEKHLEVSITFGELECFDSEDVSSCVSKETALKISNKSLEDLSAKTVDVLSLWLRKLLRAYINETECCIDVFKCLYEWFLRLKGDVTPENKAACSDFIRLLADALDFAEWAKTELLKAGERLVHTTAFFLLAIVYSCLQLSHEDNVDALKEHEPMAIDLHLTVLYLLKEITASSSKVHARITPLLRQLVEIADFLSVDMTHLHAFVKTSQTMTNICTHYNSCSDSSQDEANSMPDWLQETVLHLCDTVLNNLELVYQKQDSVPVPDDKMEEYLKVTQAYLIMLHKLLGSGVRHIDKSVCDTLMVLLSGAEIKASLELGQHIPVLISKYVRPYIMQIYELLYQCEDFQKHLTTYLAEPEQLDQDNYELCLDFITVSIVDQTELSQRTCQTLQRIFEYLCKDAGNFTNAARYDRLLEVFGCLLHVASSATLLNYFCAGFFQEDIIKSQVCADVLMLCFRLEESNQGWSKNALIEAEKYWIKCNNSYAMFSQNLSQLHVKRMLKYFHSLSKTEPPAFNIRNYRYLHCVSAKCDQQQQRLWLLRLQRILNEPLSDTEQYYEILALMELLSTGQVDWLQQTAGSVKELLLSVKDKCKSLANTYFKLALKSNTTAKLRILQTAMPAKAVANSCWHVQRFLHACKRSDDAQLKFLADQHPIAMELVPLLDAVQPASVCKPNADKLQIDYRKFTYGWNQTHNCSLGSLKRKRAESASKDLLRLLEQNTMQLHQCSAELDANDLQQLRSIVDNLKQILVGEN